MRCTSTQTQLYDAQPSQTSQLAQHRTAAQRVQQQQQQHMMAEQQREEHMLAEHQQQQRMSEVKSTSKGEVEVVAKTLKQSLAEARKLGFKGEPTAIVYHPAHGAEKTYVLEH